MFTLFSLFCNILFLFVFSKILFQSGINVACVEPQHSSAIGVVRLDFRGGVLRLRAGYSNLVCHVSSMYFYPVARFW